MGNANQKLGNKDELTDDQEPNFQKVEESPGNSSEEEKSPRGDKPIISLNTRFNNELSGRKKVPINEDLEDVSRSPSKSPSSSHHERTESDSPVIDSERPEESFNESK